MHNGMEIQSNPPILFYGFKILEALDSVHANVHSSLICSMTASYSPCIDWLLEELFLHLDILYLAPPSSSNLIHHPHADIVDGLVRCHQCQLVEHELAILRAQHQQVLTRPSLVYDGITFYVRFYV